MKKRNCGHTISDVCVSVCANVRECQRVRGSGSGNGSVCGRGGGCVSGRVCDDGGAGAWCRGRGWVSHLGQWRLTSVGGRRRQV